MLLPVTGAFFHSILIVNRSIAWRVNRDSTGPYQIQIYKRFPSLPRPGYLREVIVIYTSFILLFCVSALLFILKKAAQEIFILTRLYSMQKEMCIGWLVIM